MTEVPLPEEQNKTGLRHKFVRQEKFGKVVHVFGTTRPTLSGQLGQHFLEWVFGSENSPGNGKWVFVGAVILLLAIYGAAKYLTAVYGWFVFEIMLSAFVAYMIVWADKRRRNIILHEAGLKDSATTTSYDKTKLNFEERYNVVVGDKTYLRSYVIPESAMGGIQIFGGIPVEDEGRKAIIVDYCAGNFCWGKAYAPQYANMALIQNFSPIKDIISDKYRRYLNKLEKLANTQDKMSIEVLAEAKAKEQEIYDLEQQRMDKIDELVAIVGKKPFKEPKIHWWQKDIHKMLLALDAHTEKLAEDYKKLEKKWSVMQPAYVELFNQAQNTILAMEDLEVRISDIKLEADREAFRKIMGILRVGKDELMKTIEIQRMELESKAKMAENIKTAEQMDKDLAAMFPELNKDGE